MPYYEYRAVMLLIGGVAARKGSNPMAGGHLSRIYVSDGVRGRVHDQAAEVYHLLRDTDGLDQVARCGHRPITGVWAIYSLQSPGTLCERCRQSILAPPRFPWGERRSSGWEMAAPREALLAGSASARW
jgi:hypothetical protein